MNARLRSVTLSLSKGALVLGLTACQGGFGSGGTSAPGGVNPPVNAQMPANVMPASPTPHPSGSPTTPPGNSVTYPAADAAKGLKCPEDQGFSCTLTLAVVTPAPSGSPSASPSGSSSPSPTPSPTPTPTPTPSPTPSGSASPGASPSPHETISAGPHITLTIAGMPKDAPKMNDPNPKAVATIALVTLRLRPDANIVVSGKSSADFTLPKEQIGGRGFAVQLYRQSVSHKHVDNTFVGTYNSSKLKGSTLHFELTTPPLQIKKDETWMLVLYGDELPSAKTPSASPSASASASPSSSASASASPSASPSGSPSPSASPSATP